MEIRICQNCGKEFEVDSGKEFSTNKRRVLCNDCIENMSEQEKMRLYQKRSVENTGEERTCLNCGKTFYVKHKDDKTSSRIKQFCDDCSSQLTDYQKKKIKMEKIPGYADKVKADKRQSHKRNIISAILNRARTRAKKYGYDFNLEASDIIIPKICPLLEIPIYCGDKENYENSPSLDRIDNSKGYVKGNVWIISKKANSMKNSASFSELITFCENIRRYSLNTAENECSEQENKESLG